MDSHLFNKAYEAVIRSQDLYYNMQLPQASLTSQEVELGAVLFEDIRRKTITLNNTGHSHLEFKFTQEGAAAFPSWLQVHPLTARVEKGRYRGCSWLQCSKHQPPIIGLLPPPAGNVMPRMLVQPNPVAASCSLCCLPRARVLAPLHGRHKTDASLVLSLELNRSDFA